MKSRTYRAKIWNIPEWTDNLAAAVYAAGLTVHEAKQRVLSRISV